MIQAGKNILIAVPTLSSGGAERVASIWANGLAEEKNNIFLFTLYPVEQEYKLCYSVCRINMSESKEEYDKLTFLKKIIFIRNLIKKYNIKVVIPLVTYVGILFSLSCFRTNVKIIETVRNNPSLVPKSTVLKALRNISIKKAAGCIVQNQEQAEYFGEKYKEKFFVLPNPVSDEFLNCERQYSPKPNRVITMGRLHSQKNHKMLIDAICKLKNEYADICLEIYGDGPLEKELNSYVQELGMQNEVHICPRTDMVLEKLKESDIFVLSSNYEGMPNVLMEAMATGMPCISTNCPTGPSDLIIDQTNGRLIDVGDTEDLYRALEKFVAEYDRAICYGKKAKETMKEYKSDSIICRLEKYILSVTEG